MEPLNSIGAILRRVSMVLSVIIMLTATVWLIILWPNVPDTVPTHFGADGSPTEYSGKASLFGPLIVGWVIAVLFIVLEFFPQYWNIPGKENGFRISVGKLNTSGNNGAQATPGAITSMRSMMAVDRVMSTLLFAFITICSAKCAKLPIWAMAAIVAIMAGGSIFFAVQASRRNS